MHKVSSPLLVQQYSTQPRPRVARSEILLSLEREIRLPWDVIHSILIVIIATLDRLLAYSCTCFRIIYALNASQVEVTSLLPLSAVLPRLYHFRGMTGVGWCI